MAWRVITGLHHQIAYLMQVVGHTRCLIDAGFARAKKLFRRSDCDSMSELQQVVERSSSTIKEFFMKVEETLLRGSTTTGKSFWNNFSPLCLVYLNTIRFDFVLTTQDLFSLRKIVMQWKKELR